MSEFLPITRLLRRWENVTWCKRGCFKRRICPIFRWLKVQRPQGHYYYYPGIYPDLDFGDFLKWDPMKELEGVLNLNIITSGFFFCGDQHFPSHDMPGWKVQEKGICGSGDGSGLPSFVVEDTLLFISSAHSLNALNTRGSSMSGVRGVFSLYVHHLLGCSNARRAWLLQQLSNLLWPYSFKEDGDVQLGPIWRDKHSAC